jgi:hypothetical protein
VGCSNVGSYVEEATGSLCSICTFTPRLWAIYDVDAASQVIDISNCGIVRNEEVRSSILLGSTTSSRVFKHFRFPRVSPLVSTVPFLY